MFGGIWQYRKHFVMFRSPACGGIPAVNDQVGSVRHYDKGGITSPRTYLVYVKEPFLPCRKVFLIICTGSFPAGFCTSCQRNKAVQHNKYCFFHICQYHLFGRYIYVELRYVRKMDISVEPPGIITGNLDIPGLDCRIKINQSLRVVRSQI